MIDNAYLIYQLKDGVDTRQLQFETLDRVKAAGRAVEWGNYNHVYTGALETKDKPAVVDLEMVFIHLNTNRPQDFTGHSLSTSDIVVLCRNGQAVAYYVDSSDYREVPEFLDAPYKYYSTQRPVDIATYPKTESGPVNFTNFDKRELCGNATFRAWGYLAYDAPLTQKQISDYELRAASGNPDRVRLSPYQMEAQTQIVGKWEKAHRVPDVKRLTWWYSDFGVFVKKDWVKNEQVAERIGQITGAKSHTAEKTSISEINGKPTTTKPIRAQLADAAKKIERGADTSVKNKSKSHEDR